MRMPSKVTTYKNSSLPVFLAVIKELQKGDIAPSELCHRIYKKGIELGELLEVLDCLYVLEMIDLDKNKEVLIYVKRNMV